MTPPELYGRYQILERIAAGGMAEVFLARSVGLEGFEKRLVIKRILPELAKNARFVSMFVQEAKLSVSLSHPNIVQVYDLGKVQDDHYIAMEYIHGKDLTVTMRTLRRNGERFPIPLACSIAANVARGLGYAHARTAPDGRPLHIVHRDVSPHNVMLSFEGDVKIVDFGIARLAGESTKGGAPGPGGGKFAYMSPEQAAGQAMDARSDLFSLGVVLFEMLAGRRLFQDADPEVKLRQVIECQIPDVRTLRPDVPEPLVAILARALARDPADRYPTASAFEEDLLAHLYRTGARHDAAPLRVLMSELFPDEAQGGRGAAALDLLAEDLDALHTGVDPEPTHSSAASSVASARTTSEERRRLPVSLAERRPVVVLVAEASGLTDVSARAEVEEVGRIHIRMLRMVRSLIDRMGGSAQRFEDDTLLVIFGLPRALGDDLERALACARELHRLGARLRRRGLAVDFALGIHLGELNVTRRVGRRFRYAARGDTIKLATRLALAADPGTTLVSDRVAALAGDRFPFERGPALRRKGTRHTRATFLLAGGRRSGLRGYAGRWYRRGAEVEVLRDAIARLRDGHGSRIGVRGPAGSGKSRLFREFRDLAARREVSVFQGRAFPHAGDRPLAGFRDLMADILGIRADNDATVIRQRLARLHELGLDASDVDVIASLFALELGERKDPPKEAMFATAARLVKGLAADGPVVVLMEDIQYFDAFEREMWTRLVAAAEGEPVLSLASWRAESDDLPGFQKVALGPLAPDQVASMAADLLGADAIGPDLTRLVMRTAEGNPLYLEEVLKALQQSGRIYHEAATARLRDPHVDPGLPDTLQGLLTARIDALEPASRGALQLAAVIGNAFHPNLLAASVGAEEPSALLSELVRAGLVVPEARAAETAYVFSSVLIWECVLRSILGIQRKEFHRMVAAGMERVYGERLDTVRESWAHHAWSGGRVRDAAAGMARVGDLHLAAWRLEAAFDCYQKGLAWMQAAPREQQDAEVEALLHLGSGEAALLLHRPRALSHLQVALDIVSEIGPADLEARAMLALGQLYLSQGKITLARAHLDAASSMARRLADRAAQVRCLELLGNRLAEEGRDGEAALLFEEGLRIAGTDAPVRARMLLAIATLHLRRDELDDALRLLEEALPLAEADQILAGRIVNNQGLAWLARGQLERALATFRRSLEVRQGLGYRVGEVVNLHNIGDTYLRMGDPARAWASFERSRDLAREAGYERGVVMNEVFLAWLRGERGEDALGDLDRAAAAAARLGDDDIALTGRWYAARLRGRAGDPRAEALQREVRAEAERLGLRGLLRELG